MSRRTTLKSGSGPKPFQEKEAATMPKGNRWRKHRRQLNARQFETLLRHFEKIGFRSTSAYCKPVGSKKRLMAKVHAIKADILLGAIETMADKVCHQVFLTDIGEHQVITSFAQPAFNRSNTPILSAAEVFFKRYSNFNASLLVISELTPTNSKGNRDLVYLAPLPELCFNNRFSRSFVMPQYRESSTHRSKYTTQLSAPIFHPPRPISVFTSVPL